MFLQMSQEALTSQLSQERNTTNLTNFVNDFEVRYIILEKNKEGILNAELEWTPEMLKSTNVVLVKKNNFALVKDVTAFKISEMDRSLVSFF